MNDLLLPAYSTGNFVLVFAGGAAVMLACLSTMFINPTRYRYYVVALVVALLGLGLLLLGVHHVNNYDDKVRAAFADQIGATIVDDTSTGTANVRLRFIPDEQRATLKIDGVDRDCLLKVTERTDTATHVAVSCYPVQAAEPITPRK